MNLSELKASLLDRETQLILFRRDGTFVASDQALSDLQEWKGKSLYDLVPLLQSLAPALQHISGSDVIELPCVDFDFPGYCGYFDFAFQPHPEDADCLLWLIKDQTKMYRYYARVQQERNELRLEKEYRDLGKSA